jgi:hypothetical protein
MYKGRIRGIAVHPHPSADPLHFHFGDDLFMQDYCKTQFAGVEIHTAIITLLSDVAQYFKDFQVDDEGEYWASRNKKGLVEHFNNFDKALAKLLKQYPDARVAVHQPNGRIIDAIT